MGQSLTEYHFNGSLSLSLSLLLHFLQLTIIISTIGVIASIIFWEMSRCNYVNITRLSLYQITDNRPDLLELFI